jgi:hypothetical protein
MPRPFVCWKLRGFKEHFQAVGAPAMGILVLEADFPWTPPFLFSCFGIKTLVQTFVLFAAVHAFVQIFVLFGAETGCFLYSLSVFSSHLFAAQ